MKTIHLKGRLAHGFQSTYDMDIVSPSEGVRALCYMVPGFENALRDGEYRITRTYKDTVNNVDFGEDELALSFGRATGFIIEPVVGGAKNGLGKLVLGIVLIGAAFFAPMAIPLLTNAAGTAIISSAQIGMMGVTMALQGASMLLTKTPNSTGPADDQSSFLLYATSNLIEQGHAVPVVFGECFVGSVVISTGITAEEIAVG